MSCCCSRTASSCSAPSDGGWRWHRGCCIHRHPLCEVVPGAVQAWPASSAGWGYYYNGSTMPRMLCPLQYTLYSTQYTYHGVRSDAGLHADHVQLQRVSVCTACLACPVSPRVTCHRCVRLRCPHATAGQLQYFDINPPHSAARCSARRCGRRC